MWPLTGYLTEILKDAYIVDLDVWEDKADIAINVYQLLLVLSLKSKYSTTGKEEDTVAEYSVPGTTRLITPLGDRKILPQSSQGTRIQWPDWS